MQRTVNYDLCQYEGSDKTSYLINYNGDMLKIDTAIKGAKDAADNAQSKANTADGKADANASSISTLDTQINGVSGLAADVAAVQGSVNTINSLIGSGEPTTTDKTIIGAINEIAAEIPSGELAADHVTYVNSTSGLTADDVQAAIDEVVTMIPSVVTPDADDVSYDNTASGLAATNVQDAIDGLVVESDTAKVVGKDANGDTIYEKVFKGTTLTGGQVLDASLTHDAVSHFEVYGSVDIGSDILVQVPHFNIQTNVNYAINFSCSSTGLAVDVAGYTIEKYYIRVRYTLASNA